jgi:hypothetical protein
MYKPIIFLLVYERLVCLTACFHFFYNGARAIFTVHELSVCVNARILLIPPLFMAHPTELHIAIRNLRGCALSP